MFALFEDDHLQTGTGRRNRLSLLSLLSLKPQQAKAQENGKCGHLVIWSFGHFDVSKENEKGTEEKKKTKETKKKVNIKKLKLWKRKPWKLSSISSLPCSQPSPAASAWWAACRLDFWISNTNVFLNTNGFLNTNRFWTRIFFWTRITRITRISL